MQNLYFRNQMPALAPADLGAAPSFTTLAIARLVFAHDPGPGWCEVGERPAQGRIVVWVPSAAPAESKEARSLAHRLAVALDPYRPMTIALEVNVVHEEPFRQEGRAAAEDAASSSNRKWLSGNDACRCHVTPLVGERCRLPVGHGETHESESGRWAPGETGPAAVPALSAREADGDDKIVLCPRCHGLGAFPSCAECMAPAAPAPLFGSSTAEILRASTAAAYERIRKDAETAIYAAVMPGFAAQVGFGLDSDALRLALASKVELDPVPPAAPDERAKRVADVRNCVDAVIALCPPQLDAIGWRAAVLTHFDASARTFLARRMDPVREAGDLRLSMEHARVVRAEKPGDPWWDCGVPGAVEALAYDRAVAAAGRPPAYEKRYHPRRRR